MQLDPHVRLVGILTACPFGTPREKCVFNRIREKPLSDRMHWLSNLAENDRHWFAEAHRRCVVRRETAE